MRQWLLPPAFAAWQKHLVEEPRQLLMLATHGRHRDDLPGPPSTRAFIMSAQARYSSSVGSGGAVITDSGSAADVTGTSTVLRLTPYLASGAISRLSEGDHDARRGAGRAV